jgi:methyl-accepting chemotaxis protein
MGSICSTNSGVNVENWRFLHLMSAGLFDVQERAMRFERSAGGRSAFIQQAVERSMAVIEFDPKGVVLRANANFCEAMGYAEAEIRGQHHSLFVDPQYARSAEYADFWARLRRGEHESREYRRLGKHGVEVWIQAAYTPVLNRRGKVERIIKVASVRTAEKQKEADLSGRMAALDRVQAIIEFTPDGQILWANDNFLKAMGYRLEEIVGQHHRMFVDPAYAASPDYEAHWNRLRAGEYVVAEFERRARDGSPVWIQASYNPLFDAAGRVTKIVKFATDITGRVKSVQALAGGLSELARKDLAHRITAPVEPAFERLKSDFNSVAETLSGALAAAQAAAQGVDGGSREIAQASDDLSRRTEQQAASLEETAAALEEITQTVRRTADASRQASEAASSARSEAERSGDVMRDAVQAMTEIEGSSSQIGQIIGVIDEIAFQTNLLALNAGVEAARAGEAGRGFAVVASEVRALAQRSAEAAKEIKTLITTSGAQVEKGSRLVGDTGKALTAIVEAIAHIDTLVREIAASTQEQATGMGEVNTAVNQMDQVTQQNAAMVEQATAAAANLRTEAANLSALISEFRIGGAAAAATPGRTAAPAPAARPNTAGNPVHKAQGRVVAFAQGGAAAKADWEEF